eukprot:GFKZ01015388.1.p2 GENE.GFKZ01015388.1~~GFKZ01015388.1.p2  ORF type:complete len:168 (-),score=7.07 GFKZ01015388.1:12-515(-)
MHCLHGGKRIRHHDRHVILFATALAKTTRHPVVEPRFSSEKQKRFDTRAVGIGGGNDYFDVTFVNPLAPSHKIVRCFNPLTSLNAASAGKNRRCQSFIATSTRSRLVPVPMSILGGWRRDAYAVLIDVAARAMETFGRVRSVFVEMHEAASVASNVACLTTSLAPAF